MKGNFDEIINDNKPVVVDFHALWCGPCKVQSPILKDVALDLGDKARIIKIDVDHNPQLAQRFNIQGVPTLMVFKKGQVIWRRSGVTNKNEIKSIINQNL